MQQVFGWAAKAMVGTTLAIVALACAPQGGYRVVQKVPSQGGEVALTGYDQNMARQKANDYMKAECGGGFDIVEEHEEVTGQTSQTSGDSNTRKEKDLFGKPVKHTSTDQTTTTQNTKEWRLKYKCKGDAPPSEKASTPADPAAPKTSSQIHELVVRF